MISHDSRSPTENPIVRMCQQQRVIVLDGGLATALEARGHDLNDDLWSAKLLLEAPSEIRQVHLDFLAAGADCIATSSYQASQRGFAKRGLSEEQGTDALRRSVQLAMDARDTFWSDARNRVGRLRPLVAASVGPYGAFLADGSEYTGRYNLARGDLYAFHRHRWQVLADTDADLLACETIPSADEAAVLIRLLCETPGRWAWMSFSCGDGTRLRNGKPLSEAALLCDAVPQIAAIGINCTAPEFVASLITEIKNVTQKPVIVYPNSGEQYNAVRKTWAGRAEPTDWSELAAKWARLGAMGIGGCCRTGPEDIAEMRRRLVHRQPGGERDIPRTVSRQQRDSESSH